MSACHSSAQGHGDHTPRERVGRYTAKWIADAKFALRTHRLRMYVYDLAMLHVMDEGLGSLAHILALRESVQLRTIYY